MMNYQKIYLIIFSILLFITEVLLILSGYSELAESYKCKNASLCYSNGDCIEPLYYDISGKKLDKPVCNFNPNSACSNNVFQKGSTKETYSTYEYSFPKAKPPIAVVITQGLRMTELACKFSLKQYDTVIYFYRTRILTGNRNYFEDIQRPVVLANARSLGYEIAKKIQSLIASNKADATDLQLYTHSIHAVTAYYANEKLISLYERGFTKAILLDPVFYENKPLSSLADFVSVIHTSDISKQFNGQVNIYVNNNDTHQKGCKDLKCDHFYASLYLLNCRAGRCTKKCKACDENGSKCEQISKLILSGKGKYYTYPKRKAVC